VITRHGKPIAAIMPLDTYGGAGRQQSILPLAGSGRGLWGPRSAATLRKLRREWSR
jgi:antitoxin (DNA-binding transcriptional repressor) of toxin-antitoxin stability system